MVASDKTKWLDIFRLLRDRKFGFVGLSISKVEDVSKVGETEAGHHR